MLKDPIKSPKCRDNRYDAGKIQQRLRRLTAQAITDFNMIEDGDHILVAVSGGKDSYTLMDILWSLKSKAPISFKLTAVNLDQNHPGYDDSPMAEYFQKQDIPYLCVSKDTFSIVKRLVPENKSTCSLCSRLRRGNLYGIAKKIGANKIALGHHRDDIVETFFLNLFFQGKLEAMPVKLLNQEQQHILIRPLAYCKEKDIQSYSEWQKHPILPCQLCGSMPNGQRKIIKAMLNTWDKEHPGRIETIFRSLSCIKPSQLLDPNWFNFNGLKIPPISNSEPID